MFNVIFNFLMTILLVIALLINSKFFHKRLNYLNVFVSLYYLIIILSSINLFDFTTPSNLTYIYLGIALFFFEFFSLMFLSIKLGKKQKNKFENNTKELNIKILLFLSIIVTVLMIPSTLDGIKVLKVYGFTGVRSAAFSDEVYSTYTKLFLTYILNPINKVIFIYSLNEVINKKKVKLVLTLSIINMVQYVLIFGGRSIILDTVLLTIITIYIKSDNNIHQIIKNYKKIIAIVFILIFSMIAITSERNISKDSSIFFNIYSYYVGSIHLLDVHVNNPHISLLDGEHLLHGKAMFSPFFDIFKISTKMIGLNTDFKTGMEIINEQVQLYLNVSNKVKMNNNVTFIYVCLRDFDFLGLIIGPAYIALWYSLIYKFYMRRKSILTDSLYFYMFSIIPYFIFTFYINNTVFLMTIIFIILVHKFCYNNESRLYKYEKN